MIRTQFTFYESFFKAISRIKNKSARADAYDAIVEYALYGVLPDPEKLSESACVAFELSKPNLDSSRRKAESGRLGGTKKTEANNKQNDSCLDELKKQTASKKENKKENKIENKIENKCYTHACASFAEFWEAYPRKEGIGDAEQEFKNIPEETSFAELMDALERQKKHERWQKDGGRYIPSPANWLAGKRWLDIFPESSGSMFGSCTLGDAELDAIRNVLNQPEEVD